MIKTYITNQRSDRFKIVRLRLTVIVPLLKPLIPDSLGNVDGLARRIRPLPETPKPEEKLLREIPKLVIRLLVGLYRFPGYRPAVQADHMRHFLPKLLVFAAIRLRILFQLNLVNGVLDFNRTSEEFHDWITPELLPPPPILFDLFGGRILLLLEIWVLIEDPFNLGGVPIIGFVLAFPEELVQHLPVRPRLLSTIVVCG